VVRIGILVSFLILGGMLSLLSMKLLLGMVVHICNPCTEEAEARGSRVSGQARCQRLMPVILIIWEAEIRRISVQGQPRQIV
jgi:hypothetical protein